MRILLIKTSSLGDIIHTLPALTDAGKAISDIQIDWIVEKNFAEIPAWHPLVRKIIPITLRKWRKQLFSKQTYQEFLAFYHTIRAEKYDYIIDAQGLLKTAWLGWLAKGKRCGLNWHSAREALSAIFYQQTYQVDNYLSAHAVERNRQLLSKILGYHYQAENTDYGISLPLLPVPSESNYVVFLHGTTWNSKLWPEAYWIELAKYLEKNNIIVKLSWGNDTEKLRAERIAAQCQNVEILPRLKLHEMATILNQAKAIVSVDTGLGHLAAALNVPTISLYGPTNSALTGTYGQHQQHLSVNFSCAPCLKKQCSYQGAALTQPACFATLQPDVVWNALSALIK